MLKSQVMPQPAPESVRPKARRSQRAARRTPVVVAGMAALTLSALTPAVAATKLPVQEGETVTFTSGKDES